MDADKYQRAALRTWQPGSAILQDIEYLALQLNAEAGEVAGPIAKLAKHSKPFDADALIDELGDVLWYVAVLARMLNTDLSTVMQRNVTKLQQRHPNGNPNDWYTAKTR